MLRFVPVISEPTGATFRRTGVVPNAVVQDFEELVDHCVFVAGPPPMVEAVRALVLERVVETQRIRGPLRSLPAIEGSVRPAGLGSHVEWTPPPIRKRRRESKLPQA